MVLVIGRGALDDRGVRCGTPPHVWSAITPSGPRAGRLRAVTSRGLNITTLRGGGVLVLKLELALFYIDIE